MTPNTHLLPRAKCTSHSHIWVEIFHLKTSLSAKLEDCPVDSTLPASNIYIWWKHSKSLSSHMIYNSRTYIKGKTWSTMSNIIYNVNVHLRIIFSHVFLLLLSFTTQISPSKIPLNTGAYKSLHWHLFFSEKKSVLTATKENWYRWNMMIKSVTKLLIAM